MKYQVVHTTEYAYPEPVTLCHNEVHLKPRTHARQSLLSHQIAIDPQPAVQSERVDFFGNPVLYFAIQTPHVKLSVTSTSEVELDGQSDPPHAQSTIAWQDAARRTLSDKSEDAAEARQFLLSSPMV
ncbi:MAG TPA: transglutaminase N-terminal domain-containing protein, partial [Gammaproteobacteria bacterium]|nr:transglutaminase N-terminal domain-containing protein [Gammaproteobacteria bacterium]